MIGRQCLPASSPGFTDSHYFREQGIASYGFVQFDLSEEDERGEHGVNERITIRNLRNGTQRLIDLLQLLDAEAQPDAPPYGQTP